VRVIAVTGGKGGVGKTTVSINLALALRLAGRDVMLLDADLGLANVDVLLGLQPTFNLSHVLEGKCRLADSILEGPMGLQIVPASSGRRSMAELSHIEHAGLIRAFSELDRPVDTLIIDTAAGISDSVLTFSQAAQEVLVVVCNEPASITDAYALIKVLSRENGVRRVQIVPNMVRNAAEGRQLFDNLSRVTERFLDVTLNYLGAIPHDELLRKSIQRQRAVIEAYPNCPAAQAFQALARSVDQWQAPRGARGHLEFFVERLVGNPPALVAAA
jgi:flagellar biosynthesis protein FlhG